MTAPSTFRPLASIDHTAAIPEQREPVTQNARGTETGEYFPDQCELCGGCGIWLNRWIVPQGGGLAVLGPGSPPDGKECWCPCSRGPEAREYVREIRAGNTGIKKHAQQAMTFDTFKATTEEQKQAKATLQRWAEGFRPGDRGFLLQGPPGSGKTHLLTAAANVVIDSGRASLFRIAAIDLSARYRATWARDADENEDSVRRALVSPDLLLIDDLGADKGHEGVMEFLTLVLDNRLESGRTTCFTTNLGGKKLIDATTERIYSRVERAVAPSVTHRLTKRFHRDREDGADE